MLDKSSKWKLIVLLYEHVSSLNQRFNSLRIRLTYILVIHLLGELFVVVGLDFVVVIAVVIHPGVVVVRIALLFVLLLMNWIWFLLYLWGIAKIWNATTSASSSTIASPSWCCSKWLVSYFKWIFLNYFWFWLIQNWSWLFSALVSFDLALELLEIKVWICVWVWIGFSTTSSSVWSGGLRLCWKTRLILIFLLFLTKFRNIRQTVFLFRIENILWWILCRVKLFHWLFTIFLLFLKQFLWYFFPIAFFRSWRHAQCIIESSESFFLSFIIFFTVRVKLLMLLIMHTIKPSSPLHFWNSYFIRSLDLLSLPEHFKSLRINIHVVILKDLVWFWRFINLRLRYDCVDFIFFFGFLLVADDFIQLFYWILAKTIWFTLITCFAFLWLLSFTLLIVGEISLS